MAASTLMFAAILVGTGFAFGGYGAGLRIPVAIALGCLAAAAMTLILHIGR